jgi:alpha/beta hydrolase fold
VGERMIEANGVELCTEPFGEPGDPPVLLVMGIAASMLWWEEGFCRLLAERGRFVIRYDHRDTGHSVTHEPGRPRYTGSDLVADAVGVLDAYELVAAHVVGVSARYCSGRDSKFRALSGRSSSTSQGRAASRRESERSARALDCPDGIRAGTIMRRT